ncbi:alcohol dehydrogenase GroES-like domain-containing protein [Pseudomassariella vexata]|uniref:Alcohol dehydrogenase GroES-like domain-containing protein n=1 Tax=Pseudomassariella vexata TaxID=1141098 RepID=A0A1Y2EED5_9PEZI|nr:alcohol dehydrogenase GroES-like domain-containing protein [Pseudomassariella vexata]ORY69943.1 alcohol dehydrogenase GroES-like domain-containing protein [Pseudomassariella vexata]
MSLQYNKPYELRTTSIPQIGDRELLVKIRAAGFCHSDLQPAGIIVQIGKNCAADKWQVGDRVGILNFKRACSKCVGCVLSKREYGTLDPRFCDTREMAGFKDDGAFAEYMVADPETTVHLPASLSFEQAAPLMCAGVSRGYGMGALEKATTGLKSGDTVAIDSRPEGRRLASEVPSSNLTPDLVIDSTVPDASAKILEFTNGEGLAAAVVCTDSLSATEWALTLLRIGGTIILLGLPPQKSRFDPEIIVFRELVLRGSYVASRESTERMMAMVDKSGVRSRLTIVPFDEVVSIVDAYQDKSFKSRLVVQVSND